MKTRHIRVRIMLLGLALLLHPVRAGAREAPLGLIEQARGTVIVTRADGRQVQAESGISLFPGDQVTTGKGAEVRFFLHEGAEFHMAQDSQIFLDDLSAQEVEEGETLMALVLGFLRSKIGRLVGSPGGFRLHTPTAVVGVRGTEFDTVVSLDAASAVAVDGGEVQVDLEGEKIPLGQGQMLEVQVEGEHKLPGLAPPREKRDWESWRQKRIRRLFKFLPARAPKFASKFERAVVRSGRFTEKVNAQAGEVRKAIEGVRGAMGTGRGQVRLAAQNLREEAQKFNGFVRDFRDAKIRVRAMARLSLRVERFVEEKGERFTEQERIVIESSLKKISVKREELREIFSRTTANIRETYRELRALKEERARRGRRTGGDG